MKKDTSFKKKIAALNHQSESQEFKPLIEQIRNSYSIKESKAISDKYLAKALKLIDELDEPNAQSLFIKLIKKMGSRSV